MAAACRADGVLPEIPALPGPLQHPQGALPVPSPGVLQADCDLDERLEGVPHGLRRFEPERFENLVSLEPAALVEEVDKLLEPGIRERVHGRPGHETTGGPGEPGLGRMAGSGRNPHLCAAREASIIFSASPWIGSRLSGASGSASIRSSRSW